MESVDSVKHMKSKPVSHGEVVLLPQELFSRIICVDVFDIAVRAYNVIKPLLSKDMQARRGVRQKRMISMRRASRGGTGRYAVIRKGTWCKRVGLCA
eukprot:971543-Pleurochrysis_carterae.AAC.1